MGFDAEKTKAEIEARLEKNGDGGGGWKGDGKEKKDGKEE